MSMTRDINEADASGLTGQNGGRAELETLVRACLARRETFLDIARRHGSPLYVIEEQTIFNRADEFIKSFEAELPDIRVFYALKANSHPLVVEAAVKAELGLDVSSGTELRMALASGARSVVFSGPAKTEDELSLAVRNSERVTVLLDSPVELDRLELRAGRENVTVRAGVRLATNENGLWRKFGIHLSDLAGFMSLAEKAGHVDLRGLQFHTSWNFNPAAYVEFIGRLGSVLRSLSPETRSRMEFIDIGGGFWPCPGQWELKPQVPGCGTERTFLPSAPIAEFARRIGEAIRADLFPHVPCRICMEPGRWICNDAMHLLLTVLDRKGDDIAITDGGINAVGWERFESEYFPVINLSRPENIERPFKILGSLCTPHDVWGFSYYGSDVQPGDVLLIPSQGAYTYTLRQRFIKPLPDTVLIRPDGSLVKWREPQ